MNSSIEINKLLKEFQTGNKLQIYKKLLKISKRRSDDLLLRYNIAVIEQELNLNNEARINYNFIIKKQNNLKAMVNLYNIDLKEDKYRNALETINKIIQLNQELEFVKKDKAFALLKLKRVHESKTICKKLLESNKNDLNTLNILGLCFFAEENYNESKKIFNNILKVDKENISALNSLGRINHEQRNSKEAEKYFIKALEINSSAYQVLNNIAGFYREEGEYKKSIKFYLRALKINPNNLYILNNLSKSYFDIDELDLSEDYALQALKHDKDDGNIQKILSFIYLRRQNYEKGWFFFDGRLNLSDFIERNDTILKIRGKLLNKKFLPKEKKILILREQGVGDEILYGTMYKDILNCVSNIIIECDKRLLKLYRNSFQKYKDKFVEFGEISNYEKKLNNFDNILYAGSLGKYFRKEKKDFNVKPYLIPDKKEIRFIQNILSKCDGNFNIGFSWRSFKNRYSNEKSLQLSDFKNFFKLKNCNFINLQYGDVESDLKKFEKNTATEIITLSNIDLFNDFDGLAALLSNLDLFVTVSNSTAHLAGALGVKTLLIKPTNHALFHYWSQPDDKTPWYNSIKLVNREFLKKSDKEINNYINFSC